MRGIVLSESLAAKTAHAAEATTAHSLGTVRAEAAQLHHELAEQRRTGREAETAARVHLEEAAAQARSEAGLEHAAVISHPRSEMHEAKAAARDLGPTGFWSARPPAQHLPRVPSETTYDPWSYGQLGRGPPATRR